MNNLRVTYIQTSLHWESPDKNLDMLAEKISLIKEETDVLILPEMFSSGFTMNASTVADATDGLATQWMRKIAIQKNCAVTGSLVIEENKKYYNRLIWMLPDGTFHHYDKRHLFRLSEEEKTYMPGTHQMVMNWKGWKIYPLVCYDLRFPVWSRRKLTFDYDLLIYVANWPDRRIQAWKTLLPARAVENQCYVVGVNRVGYDGNNFEHSGESAVYDYKGEILSSQNTGEEITETVSLELESLQEFRQKFPFWRDADEFEIRSTK